MVAKIKKGTVFLCLMINSFFFPMRWKYPSQVPIISLPVLNSLIRLTCYVPHTMISKEENDFVYFAYSPVKASSQCTYTVRKCYVFWIRIYIWKIGIVAEIRILVNKAVNNLPDCQHDISKQWLEIKYRFLWRAVNN